MKGKVIKTTETEAVIGWSDGVSENVSFSKLGFRPEIGSEIEKFINGDKTDYHQSVVIYHPYDDKKVVNKFSYAVLAIILGCFGVHKFYVGKIGMGILYLLFSWTIVPALVGIIEGAVAISQKADSQGNILV